MAAAAFEAAFASGPCAELRNRLTVRQAILNHPQRQQLSRVQGFLPGPPINRDARKGRYISDPSSVLFTRELDFEAERSGLRWLFHYQTSLPTALPQSTARCRFFLVMSATSSSSLYFRRAGLIAVFGRFVGFFFTCLLSLYMR